MGEETPFPTELVSTTVQARLGFCRLVDPTGSRYLRFGGFRICRIELRQLKAVMLPIAGKFPALLGVAMEWDRVNESPIMG